MMQDSANENEDWRKELDFPSSLPALLVKELRQSLRSRGLPLFMIALPVFLAFPFVLSCIRGYNGKPIIPATGLQVFLWLGMGAILLLWGPLRAATAVQKEKTYDGYRLLLLSHLTPWQISFQKWLSYFVQTLLMLSLLVPFFILRYYLGGVELWKEIQALYITLIVSAVLISLFLWLSGLNRILRGLIVFFGFCFFSQTIGFLGVFSGGSIVRLVEEMTQSGSLWIMILPLITGMMLILFFINFTARYFASDSDNFSAPLRTGLLGGGLIYVGLICALTWSDSFSDSRILLVMAVGTFILIMAVLDCLSRDHVMAVHIDKLSRKKLYRPLSALLLPCWQSGVLFLLIFILLEFACIVLLVEKTGEMTFLTAMLAGLTVWSNIALPLIISQRMFRNTRFSPFGGFVLYVICLVLFLAFIKIFRLSGGWENFLPGGSLRAAWYSYENSIIGAAVFSVVVLIIYALSSWPFWRAYISYVRKLKQSREK